MRSGLRMRCWVLGCLILSALGVGCASAPRSDAPAMWPASCDGRRAFSAGETIVYARSESTVDEVERIAMHVAREFNRRTGGQITRGLIIVTDVEDHQIGRLPLEHVAPSTLVPAEIRGLAIEHKEMVLASPIELSRQDLTESLGFSDASAASIAWAVAIPSRRRLEQTADRMLEATLENPQLGALERALITGFKPMFATCIADTVGGTREAILYKQFCDSQPGWDQDRSRREFNEFSPPERSVSGIPEIAPSR